ncbi:hypothetical protein MIR68_001739 [Amoeboaphelidium protococcarum]|nr:hypothetical protein MIR68_001739 [Amoeboaphelidium protococcarum]
MSQQSDSKREGDSQGHALYQPWSLWFTHRPVGTKMTEADYESGMHKVNTANTVEEYWAMHQWLNKPSAVPPVTDYMLFKDGVKPMWEDEENVKGGKWMVRLKKELSNRVWENIAIALVGGEFVNVPSADEGQDAPEVTTEQLAEDVCGIVLSLRAAETIVSVWNKDCQNEKLKAAIRQRLMKVLELPAGTILEYKNHSSALKDKSSFSNTRVFKQQN